MSSEIVKIQNNPFKSWLVFSVPIIILMLFHQSYTIFDTFLLSQLGNDVIIALGFVSQIYYFLSSMGSGISRAVSSMVARLIGAQKYESIDNVVLHGLFILIIVSIISQFVFAIFSYNILGLFVPNAQIQLVHVYMIGIFAGFQIILISIFLTEMINAEGRTRLSTAIMVFGIFLNIIFDYIFVVYLNMHMFGASLGTVISYLGTTLIYLYLCMVKKDQIIRFNFKAFKFDSTIIRKIIISSVPLIIDSLMVSLAGILVVTALNKFAQPITIVAYYLIIRIQLFLFTPIIGLAKSGNIIIGHLFGAKRFTDVISQMNKAIIITFVVNCVILLFLFIFMNMILGVFTTEPDVLIEAKNIIYLVILEGTSLVVIWNCNYGLIAIGHSPNCLYSLIIKLSSLSILIYILCFVLDVGKMGVFASLILANTIQCFYSYFTFKRLVLKASEEPQAST